VLEATAERRVRAGLDVSGPPRLITNVKHHMGAPKRNQYARCFAPLFVLSLIVGVVFEYVAFCVQDGIGTDWITVGLVCWGILISCSEKYVRWLAGCLARRFSARFDSEA
jgi:hypothetical protein